MSAGEHSARDNLVRWSWAPALILVLGAVSLTLLLGSNWIRERLVITDMVRLDALVELQLTAATVHLWLEEYVAGDQIDFEEIAKDLDRAAYLIETLVEGGAVDGVELPPLGDPELKSDATRIAANQKLFTEVSATRKRGFEAGLDVGIGSSLDVAFDAVFAALRSQTRALEARIRTRLSRNRVLSQALFHTILASWVVVIFITVTGLWTRERRSRRAVQALAKSEADLIQSQKMEAVGRLASGVNHDINNYLAAITTNCELMQMQGGADAEVGSKVDAILTVVGKASSLVDQLLAFSRHQPVQAEVVNLNEVITGMELMLRRLAGEDTEFEIGLAAALWNTEIDPSQFEQVLVNLLLNARQAMPTGGKIAIETANVSLHESITGDHPILVGGDYVMLTVTDSGPGIPAEIRSEVFEPFFTTKDKSTNSGLGLATVYGIAMQNHGSVGVGGEPGEGATLKVYLPRVLAETLKKEAKIPPPPVRDGGNECVLLVEDNDDFRDSAAELLIELGYSVLIARDGIEALRVHDTNRERIDLVISDVVMPDMNGRDLVDAIRLRGNAVPVLYISGYTENVILDYGIVDRPANLLRKPFSAERLVRKIHEVLSAAAAASGEASPGTEL